ncbi:hypothetical protein QW71_34305 [Paenibacillus sp. IHB B 3415]|nr:hypothetical protein QW71_34305 [Paenibacillus sp. IHB B 3415]
MSVADRWSEGIGSALSLIPIPGMKYVGKYGTEGAVLAGKGIGKLLGLEARGIGLVRRHRLGTELDPDPRHEVCWEVWD